MLDKSFQNFNVYNKALDACWLKNQAIANNMANVNTPGYKREVVNFDAVLKSQLQLDGAVKMKTTNGMHMTGPQLSESPIIEKEANTSFRKDDNNVNIDVEESELAANSIKYNYLANELNKNISRLKLAIKGR